MGWGEEGGGWGVRGAGEGGEPHPAQNKTRDTADT